jgi:uncharacterized membrane protein
MLSNIVLIYNRDELKTILTKWTVAFVTLMLLDYIWLKFMNMYDMKITKINYLAAIISWLLVSFAITIHSPLTLKDSAIYGAYIGFIIYGVYNSTNYAIMDGWPIKIALLDTMWGVTVCSIVSVVLFFLFKKS